MDEGVAAEIEEFARAHLAAEDIEHAVIAVSRDGVRHAFAHGAARLEEPLPIASIGKSLTALVVARCGVDLDDEVQRHLPIFPFPGITIRTVLAHESGLVEGLDSSPTPLGEVLLLRDTELGPPVFRRSNSGYTALGLVAERFTGATYGELVERLALTPLGLRDSRAITTAADRPAWFTREPWVPTDAAAGATLCPIGDLLRFAEQMPELEPPHALGEDDEDGYLRLGLSGNCPGFQAHAYTCPETSAAVAIIYTTPGSTWAILQHALATLRGSPLPELYTYEPDPEPTGVRYASFNPWCPWVQIDLAAATITYPSGPEPLTPLPDGRYRIGPDDSPELLELRDPLDGVAVTAVVSGATFYRVS